MSFLDQIEKIQKKPEVIRQKILAITVISIMIVIILIWTKTIDLSLNNPVKSEQLSKTKTKILDEEIGPLALLKKTLASGIKNLKEMFGKNIYDKDH
jgi:hypothetical protein